MAFHDIGDDLFGLFKIIAVSDAEFHVDATFVVGGDVGNHVVPNFVVGNVDGLVIESVEGRRNQIHLMDGARDTARVDNVPHIKRTVDQNHQPTGKVAERVL